MSIRRIIALVAVIALAAAPAGPGVAEAAEVLKLSHTTNETHPWHKGALRFAAAAKEKSGGALEVTVFPNNQLGQEREALELIKSGTIQIGIQTVGSTSNLVPSMNLFNLPFLFRTEEEARKFAAGSLGTKLMATCDRAGYRCLALHSSFFRYPMNSKRPLREVSDFNGIKMRTMPVPAHVDTYRALGASPTPVAFGDLYNALAFGTVDGNENAIVTLEGLKMYEVQKFLSLVPVFPTTGLILVSKRTWDRLSPAHRTALEEAARSAAETIDRAYVEDEKRSLEILKAKGIQVNKVRDLTEFAKAVQPIYDKYVPTLPKEAQEVVQELVKGR
jgi:tripartite ATP-independent transporter DctP family solute receptor